MKRREFVRNSTLGAIGVPFVLNEVKYNTLLSPLFKTQKATEDRVLVIIRMNGGNDGLNTVVPMDNYDNLNIQRNNIILPQASILDLGVSNLGLNPAMSGMRDVFNNGKLSVIQSVGYASQNRSHFKSMEIWSNASEQTTPTGWLGRYLDGEFPGYPDGYPNDEYPDPFAISSGYQVSSTCQGIASNFSMAVNNPDDIGQLGQSVIGFDSSIYGGHLDWINQIVAQSNQYATRIETAYAAGNSMSALYPDGNFLAEQLQGVAKLISGGLGTKIYVLNINGFDTHDGQVVEGDTVNGTHTQLLKTLSDAITAFQDDLSLLGLEERVLGMTFSEFGRQIASNASIGTDHGDAAPLFLFGSCIDNAVVGTNPVIPDAIVPQAGVDVQLDFRDVYASILKDWFGAPEADIQALFDVDVNFMSIADACNPHAGVEEHEEDLITKVKLYPNPVINSTTLEFFSLNEKVAINLFDLNGRIVNAVFAKKLNKQAHNVQIDCSSLSTGTYILKIEKESGNISKQIIKK